MNKNLQNSTIIGSAIVAAVLGGFACGTDSPATGVSPGVAVGGAVTGNGGTSATTDTALGGAPLGGAATGNGGSNATGGAATGNGGNNATGGAVSANGGNNATGGAVSANGGNNATGGAVSANGGNNATGGASTSKGGSTTSTGGKATTSEGGAATTTGGAATSTGGKATTSTGGTATNTGGKAATGGAATSVGGSTGTTSNFSFFVISYKAIQAKSGSAQGFGGDLRYGTGDGLAGADKICTEVAETSMPGNGKTWKAYLSTSTVNAIDRIGEGPWYDRLGRVVTANKAGLLATRPVGANSAIANDLPNENGVPNHAPDGSQVDNHDTLTGTNHLGTVFGSSAHCTNWTSSTASTSAKPRVGHTWPRGSTSGSGNTAGMAHWASALDESGCGKGVNLVETGGPGNDGTVGSGGGYGGWYCFATTP